MSSDPTDTTPPPPLPDLADDDIPIVGIIGQSDADFRPKTQRSIRRAGLSAMARARCDMLDPEALVFLAKALEFAEMRLQYLNDEVTALEQRYKRATFRVVRGGKDEA